MSREQGRCDSNKNNFLSALMILKKSRTGSNRIVRVFWEIQHFQFAAETFCPPVAIGLIVLHNPTKDNRRYVKFLGTLACRDAPEKMEVVLLRNVVIVKTKLLPTITILNCNFNIQAQASTLNVMLDVCYLHLKLFCRWFGLDS